jgi:SAM-dependent methyltransferase
MKFFDIKQAAFDNYQNNYKDLPFENILREYRKKNILETLKKYPHSRFFEIGCGLEPLFIDIKDFDKMVIVEPCKLFYETAMKLANANQRIIIVNDLIENIIDPLHQETFDFIYIGGFLHEIQNPDIVLKKIRNICSKNTVIYTWVPNARSFHRLLAFEMGIIESVYQKSEHDNLFQRQNVFDIDKFSKLLTMNGFKIIKSGSYFIKPFTHDQMNMLLNNGIIDKSGLDGLNKMIKYLPEWGAELFTICKINY